LGIDTLLANILVLYVKLECGPMPNVMAALPNIGGALCESSVIPFLVQRQKVWLTPAARLECGALTLSTHDMAAK